MSIVGSKFLIVVPMRSKYNLPLLNMKKESYYHNLTNLTYGLLILKAKNSREKFSVTAFTSYFLIAKEGNFVLCWGYSHAPIG